MGFFPHYPLDKKKERKKKNFISGEIFPMSHFAKDICS
jgi:hypothetical protein